MKKAENGPNFCKKVFKIKFCRLRYFLRGIFCVRIEGSDSDGREIDDPRVVIREQVTPRFRKDRLNINFYASSHIYLSARNSFGPADVSYCSKSAQDSDAFWMESGEKSIGRQENLSRVN